MYSKFGPKQRTKCICNVGQATKQGSVKFLVEGSEQVKEGHPLRPHVEQKIKRRDLQGLDPSQRMPVDFPYPTRDIPQSLGIWKTISEKKEEPNPQISHFLKC